jgi:hypothetical protein
VWGCLPLVCVALLAACEMRDEQAAKVPRIGFLAVGSREGRAFLIDGFLRGLREHGYVEGKNIVISTSRARSGAPSSGQSQERRRSLYASITL